MLDILYDSIYLYCEGERESYDWKVIYGGFWSPGSVQFFFFYLGEKHIDIHFTVICCHTWILGEFSECEFCLTIKVFEKVSVF